jgi:sugar lactone lactonase YvrE
LAWWLWLASIYLGILFALQPLIGNYNMLKLAVLILLLTSPILASAQEVSTLVDSINASGDISLGPDGNLYVADFGQLLSNANGTTVYKVTPQGVVSTFATGFSGASGNAFDASGNLIQANITGGSVDRVSPAGVRTTIASTGLAGPVGVAVASNGDIFVANCGGNSISRISNGVVSAFVTGKGLSCPNGLTFDPDGNLYAINFNNGNIYKIDPQGQIALLATTPGSSFKPSGGNGHIVYGNGRMYLTSNANSQIFEMTLDGQLSVVAGSGALGSQDGPAEQATFSLPNGIAISLDGRFLYVNSAHATTPNPLNGNTFQLNPTHVRVIDLGSSFTINSGLNDAWYNPATNGQGFLIVVFPDIKQVFVAWFTFDTERPADGVTAILGGPGQRWFTAQGPYEGDTANLTLFVTEGGVFDSAQPPVNTDPAGDGTITIEFADCSEALVTYVIDSLGISGEIPIQRIVSDNETLCEML